ncbi:MAG: SAF domain-containing protein [Acidimicrobiales bacterium]
MTALLERSGMPNGESRTGTGTGTGTGAARDRLPASVRVRRPVLAVASVALVFASIATFVGIYSGANRRIAVITVSQPVPQGQRITARDLGVAHLSASGSLSPVPVAEARNVVGKVAVVTLVPGSMLTMAEVSASQPIKPGDAVVGISLKNGQLPASGLQPGDRVMVVQTETPGTPAPNAPASGSSISNPPQSNTPVSGASASSASASSTPASATAASAAFPASGSGATGYPTGVLVPDALVFGVVTPVANSAGSGSELVSVEVSSTVAAAVSVAAASDQISLVLLPQGVTGS